MSPGDKPTNPKDVLATASKLPLHLWPASATALGCVALFEGALKYGRANWRASGARASIYRDALYRHVDAWFEGEELDPQSGLPHIGHALACLAIIADAQAAGMLVDDRQFPGGFRAWIEKLTAHVPRLRELYANRDTARHYTIQDATGAHQPAHPKGPTPPSADPWFDLPDTHPV